MSAGLAPFSNGEFRLLVDQDETDGFRVKAPGLARALGFREAHDLLRSIPEAEKGSELVRTPGGDQQCGYVTEAGFYRALGQRQSARIADPDMRDAVERFQSWVYREVLPAIRKAGRYEVAIPTSFAEALELAASQARQLEAVAPKVDAFDTYMDADNALAMGAAANQLGIGRNTMMRKLREAGVLQKDNRPYQQYAKHFKVVAQSYEAQTETRATYTTYVKPSGVELIRRVLSGGKGLVSIAGGAA